MNLGTPTELYLPTQPNLSEYIDQTQPNLSKEKVRSRILIFKIIWTIGGSVNRPEPRTNVFLE
jgi:hypothetical protein